MNPTQRIFISLLFLVIGSGLSAQFSSKSKKAIKLFKEAQVLPTTQLDPATRLPDFKAGIALLNKAIGKDPQFYEAYLLRAEFNLNVKDSEGAISDYESALRIAPEHSRTGMTFYRLGDLYMDKGDYTNSLRYIQQFIKHPNANEDYMEMAISIKESALFAIDAIKNPKPLIRLMWAQVSTLRLLNTTQHLR